MGGFGPGEKEFVVLADDATGIRILGELVLNDQSCIVEGVVEGIRYHNPFTRPEQLCGFSSKRGRVWIDRVVQFSPTIPSNRDVPAKVRLAAACIYFGAFHPQKNEITRLTCSLEHIPRLTDSLPVERTVSDTDSTVTWKHAIDIHSLELFSDNDLRILLEYWPSIGEQVSYRQNLVVELKSHSTLAHASAHLDRVLVLLSLIAGGRIESPYRGISSTNGSTTEWKANADSEDVSDHGKWLERPARCADLLMRLLPGWMGISDEERLLAHIVVSASSSFMETRFLSYVQTFESLNALRVSHSSMDQALYDISVVKPLNRPGIRGGSNS